MPPTIAHRLMGDWHPTPGFFESLRTTDARDADSSKPYPFCLAHPIEAPPSQLGDPGDWVAEWKWDGIRAQLIRREGQVFLWSRGEELVTERYPELQALGTRLPEGTVIDGEILPWRDEAPLPFAQLQRRIGRKNLGKKILEEVPVILMAYDLLEADGATSARNRCLIAWFVLTSWRLPLPIIRASGSRLAFPSPPGRILKPTGTPAAPEARRD